MMREDGFSGLEAAIILIAFVVIAAVFAAATIGSGFLVSSKAQDTTQTSMKSASSGVYISGGLYGSMSSSGHLDKLTFYIAIPETGLDADLNKMTMAYTQQEIPSPVTKTLQKTADHDHFSIGTDGTVDPANPVILHAGMQTRVNFVNLEGPTVKDFFTIEIKPHSGPSYLLERYLAEGFEGGVIR